MPIETEQTVLILWDEVPTQGRWKFAYIVADMRTAHNALKTLCGDTVHPPTGVERIENVHQIVLTGRAPHGRVAVTRHTVHRDEPTEADRPYIEESVLARREYDRIAEEEKDGRPARFKWTHDVEMGVWFTQAEPGFPDGRFSIREKDGQYHLYGYETGPAPIHSSDQISQLLTHPALRTA